MMMAVVMMMLMMMVVAVEAAAAAAAAHLSPNNAAALRSVFYAEKENLTTTRQCETRSSVGACGGVERERFRARQRADAGITALRDRGNLNWIPCSK